MPEIIAVNTCKGMNNLPSDEDFAPTVSVFRGICRKTPVLWKNSIFAFMEKDEFLTMAAPSEGYYTELRSKFMAYAFPVSEETEAKTYVSDLKRRFHDARHVAYAYIIGVDGECFRANDDGEPSGTAGKPILGQIRSKGLTDTFVAVVRYFGGVKLGTSRLAEAYKAAAADALEKAGQKRCFVEQELTLRFGYERMSAVMKVVRDANVRIVENGYDDGCVLKVSMRKSLAADFCSRLDRTIKVEGNE